MRYISDDGKIFDSREECLGHEKNMKGLSDLIKKNGVAGLITKMNGEKEWLVILAQNNSKDLISAYADKRNGGKWLISAEDPTDVRRKYSVNLVNLPASDALVGIVIKILSYCVVSGKGYSDEVKYLELYDGAPVCLINFLPEDMLPPIDILKEGGTAK